MNVIKSVDPFRCRLWQYHDRIEDHVNEYTCKEEIHSFQQHGQLVPALGRPIVGDPDFDYEIICGARRLFVARHINRPLRVEVRPLSDRDALIAMDLENRQRNDLSPYERGISYARWLRSGLLQSQEDVAKTLNISPSQVSRLLKLARLPTVVVNAFDDPCAIRERWALTLASLLDDDRQRVLVIAEARVIGRGEVRPSPPDVYRRLVGSTRKGSTMNTGERDKLVRATDGRLLFRVRRQQRSVALILPDEHATAERIKQIEGILASFLDPHPRATP